MYKWLGLALVVLVLDQASKFAAMAYLVEHEPVPVLPLFNLRLSYNPGAAFSFLAGQGGWQRWFFAALALGVSAFLVRWLHQLGDRDRWLSASLALVLGGAIGNLIDRLAYGKVVDFIDVYYGAWHWPVFNLADSAITLGVIGIFVHMLFTPATSKAER